MSLRYILVLTFFLPVAAVAQANPGTGLEPLPAAGAVLGDFLWQKRPLVVFADTPADPAFVRQMEMLAAEAGPLAERDVIVISDTDPAAQSEVRQRLRPRGFSLVLMDKDGDVKRRVPAPWTVREITHAIDRFPLRRQEVRDWRPAPR